MLLVAESRTKGSSLQRLLVLGKHALHSYCYIFPLLSSSPYFAQNFWNRFNVDLKDGFCRHCTVQRTDELHSTAKSQSNCWRGLLQSNRISSRKSKTSAGPTSLLFSYPQLGQPSTLLGGGSIGSLDSFPVIENILTGFLELINELKGGESQNLWTGYMFDLYNPTEGSIDTMLRNTFEGSYAQSSFRNQSIYKELQVVTDQWIVKSDGSSRFCVEIKVALACSPINQGQGPGRGSACQDQFRFFATEYPWLFPGQVLGRSQVSDDCDIQMET